MVPAPIAAVALAAALAIAASPAAAQSYEETVNFIVTGNPATSEVSFGNETTVATTSRISGYNANNCTFDVSFRQTGMWAFASLFLAPPLQGDLDPSLGDNDDAAEQSKDAIYTTVRYNLNAVSNWKVNPLATQYGLHGYDLIMEGTGSTITTGAMYVSSKPAAEIACTAGCGMIFPPDTDLDRFSKAMDYLYSEYCTGSYSAF